MRNDGRHDPWMPSTSSPVTPRRDGPGLVPPTKLLPPTPRQQQQQQQQASQGVNGSSSVSGSPRHASTLPPPRSRVLLVPEQRQAGQPGARLGRLNLSTRITDGTTIGPRPPSRLHRTPFAWPLRLTLLLEDGMRGRPPTSDVRRPPSLNADQATTTHLTSSSRVLSFFGSVLLPWAGH